MESTSVPSGEHTACSLPFVADLFNQHLRSSCCVSLCLRRGHDGEQTVTDLLSGNDQVQPSPCGHYEMIHLQRFFKILLFIPGEPAAGAGLGIRV